jgi:NDP-sugar pyrophosphorylase family protein
MKSRSVRAFEIGSADPPTRRVGILRRMTMTLLGLAAGMGSRFGGPKQLEPIGPSGETILDFSIHDARRAGFDHVVLVIRAELRDAFERGLVARWRSKIGVELVEQRADPPPAGAPARAKPWGTAHAVLSAAAAVRGPFAVVNGDDYYGRDGFTTLGAFLRDRRDDDPTYAVAGFPLGATLSEAGGVNRAVLAVDAHGYLERAEEVKGITADGRAGERAFPLDALVSMNMWGFTRAALAQLDEGFRAFRDRNAADPRAEYLIPSVVEELIAAGRARVRVLPGRGPWYGMTYPEDRPLVAAALGDLVRRGEYPSPVWA